MRQFRAEGTKQELIAVKTKGIVLYHNLLVYLVANRFALGSLYSSLFFHYAR